MNSSMRKIIYYENILEFKKSIQSTLTVKELNNWQLCRTCLSETNDNDVDVEKICIMDAETGRLLKFNEMMAKITTIQIDKGDDLPSKLCKECLEKVTNLYYFSIQIEKAQNVLSKLFDSVRNVATNTVKSKDDVCTITESNAGDENDACTSTTSQKEEAVSVHHIIVNVCENELDKEINNLIKMDVEDSTTTNNKQMNQQISNSNEDGYFNDTQGSPSDGQNDDTDIYNTEDDMEQEMVDEIYTIEEDNDESLTINCVINQEERTNDRHEVKHKQPRIKKPLLKSTECGICKKVFKRQRDLVAHVKDEHPNSKAYQCRECLAYFSHTQSLSRHMNIHKPVVHKYKCKFCSKPFLRPDDLQRHIRTHTGERPYQCTICEKSFKQHSEVKQHLLTHTGQKSYKCDKCDRQFASRNSLYLHKKTHQ
ncbi:zinc finger protein 836-like [Musca vetustissima]|uniref:zinc finger protein 836-like n=1 Tax=Musca vetustissima TaxID=27455 RepID=UPI002AB7363D|nr:zinc finger protein 836-like [Musca vetustissima]